MKRKIRMSTLAIILSIVGLVLSCACIGFPIAMVGMILGIVSLKNANDKSEKTNCIVAIIAGILSIFVLVGMFRLSDNAEKKEQPATEIEVVQVINSEIENSETEVVDTENIIETEEVENTEAVVERARNNLSASVDAISNTSIPEYSGTPYVILNDNTPYFSDDELTTVAFEMYSDLDSLGRCGVAYANICKEIMPTEERGEIGSVKPSGWHTVKYDCVSGKYLYNRCHLIGFQLAGENANTKNLITGTRYLNVEGMLPFENMVDDYVEETSNHVLYRVTPVFEGNNLIASGVIIEAKSVEDNGDGILFNVYCYNVQPDIVIDYLTGDSYEVGTATTTISSESSNNSGSTQAETVTSDSEPVVEQQPVVTPEPEQNVSGGDTMVWLSATGKKYHSRNDCGNMNPDKARQVTEAQAISEGMGKCSNCW